MQLSPSVDAPSVPRLPPTLHQRHDVGRDPGLVKGSDTRTLDGDELLKSSS